MSDKKEMPIDAEVSLIWLEAKQVCRGSKSAFFPQMTRQEAQAIRQMGYEAFKERYIQGAQDGK
jgi:hypothetical protein